MADYLSPGVYVKEIPSRPQAIEGVPTSVAGFVGPTVLGPRGGEPRVLESLADFERVYGSLDPLPGEKGLTQNYLAHSARAFFENGGRRLYVARILQGTDADRHDGIEGTVRGLRKGLRAFEDVDEISLVAATRSRLWSRILATHTEYAHHSVVPPERAVLCREKQSGGSQARHLLGRFEAARGVVYAWLLPPPTSPQRPR